MNVPTKLLKTVAFLVAVAFINATSTSPARADWPLVRGDGFASGVAGSALPARLDVLWKTTLDDSGFEATAVIADGNVFVGGL